MVQGHVPRFSSMIPLILVLGVMMVAAPGVPGGAVMTAVGALQSMLGFSPTMIALIIALHLAQDSFGTATNVTGDGAIAAAASPSAARRAISCPVVLTAIAARLIRPNAASPTSSTRRRPSHTTRARRPPPCCLRLSTRGKAIR